MSKVQVLGTLTLFSCERFKKLLKLLMGESGASKDFHEMLTVRVGSANE